MKASKISLKIDSPCSESWNNMTTNKTGKFCASCSKNVIDFTVLTDSQVIEIISKSSGNLCGKLRQDQIDRVMMMRNKQNTGSRIYAILSGLLLMGASLNAQNDIRTSQARFEIDAGQNDVTGMVSTKSTPSGSILIKGQVFDESNNEVLIGATIRIKGTDYATVTDVKGKFSFELYDDFPGIFALEATSAGYSYKEIILNSKINNSITILMKPETMILGGMCVVKHDDQHKFKWWQWKRKRAYKNTLKEPQGIKSQ